MTSASSVQFIILLYRISTLQRRLKVVKMMIQNDRNEE